MAGKIEKGEIKRGEKKKKNKKTWVFERNFEKWGGWSAIGSTSSLQVGFDWVCFYWFIVHSYLFIILC
jgi:hypothetical protein